MEFYQFLIFLAITILLVKMVKLEFRVRHIENLIDEACDEIEEEERNEKGED